MLLCIAVMLFCIAAISFRIAAWTLLMSSRIAINVLCSDSRLVVSIVIGVGADIVIGLVVDYFRVSKWPSRFSQAKREAISI